MTQSLLPGEPVLNTINCVLQALCLIRSQEEECRVRPAAFAERVRTIFTGAPVALTKSAMMPPIDGRKSAIELAKLLLVERFGYHEESDPKWKSDRLFKKSNGTPRDEYVRFETSSSDPAMSSRQGHADWEQALSDAQEMYLLHDQWCIRVGQLLHSVADYISTGMPEEVVTV